MEKIKQKKSFINTIKLRRLRKKLVKINALEESMSHLSDEELKNKTEEFKNRLRTGETLEDILIEAFAAIREADRRILGMFPFDVQVLGALALHENRRRKDSDCYLTSLFKCFGGEGNNTCNNQ